MRVFTYGHCMGHVLHGVTVARASSLGRANLTRVRTRTSHAGSYNMKLHAHATAGARARLSHDKHSGIHFFLHVQPLTGELLHYGGGRGEHPEPANGICDR